MPILGGATGVKIILPTQAFLRFEKAWGWYARKRRGGYGVAKREVEGGKMEN
jgi:hypothetical protein